MNAEWKVQSALVTAFASLALTPFVTEGRELIPPTNNTIWYRLINLPGGRDPSTLGNSGDDSYTGVFQIDVNGPIGEGVRNILEPASQIAAFFKAGLQLVKGDQIVQIRRAQISPMMPGQSKQTIIVSVFWSSNITRDTAEPDYIYSGGLPDDNNTHIYGGEP